MRRWQVVRLRKTIVKTFNVMKIVGLTGLSYSKVLVTVDRFEACERAVVRSAHCRRSIGDGRTLGGASEEAIRRIITDKFLQQPKIVRT